MICKSKKHCICFGKRPRWMYKSNTLIPNVHCKCHHCILNISIISVSITIVINIPIYTYHYQVYYKTDEGRRHCRNMSVKKLKIVFYVLKILTSLLLNRPSLLSSMGSDLEAFLIQIPNSDHWATLPPLNAKDPGPNPYSDNWMDLYLVILRSTGSPRLYLLDHDWRPGFKSPTWTTEWICPW